jgi:hypothetical protein
VTYANPMVLAGKAGDIDHPDHFRWGRGPGWHGPRRKPGAPGRQRHGLIVGEHRSCQ